MAILKCKMCGGSLDLIEGSSVIYCEYCGTKQTVPLGDDEKKMNLFARANRLRFACEFDKAAGIYESIIADFPEEAEGYWGLVLCKYGIEYVDDPATAKKVPTCHRSSFESIMEDSDFEQALENADVVARSVYRNEAKQIEEIRKGIIEVSSKEEPYDIFICYKETAEDGQRTIDSVLAQNVYEVLTEKGYRVFFSRITLEDKLGQEYEPYIFAALNSAKIMLAFGTDYEYYNAVWVKNEWSRFLKLMERNKEKYLIPCFKGIDAYDIPKEFVRLQAQDLGKVGAVQDLLRGIEKLIGGKSQPENIQIVQSLVNQQNETNFEGLLKRAFIFLEDSEWKSADEYCEKILDHDPENARAYLGKLMAMLRVNREEQLADVRLPFDNNNYFHKIMRYGGDELQKKLSAYNIHIKERNEAERLRTLYSQGKEIIRYEKSEDSLRKAAQIFEQIIGYKDANDLQKECIEKAEQLRVEDLRQQEEKRKEDIYLSACLNLKSGNPESIAKAIEKFGEIPDWKDALEKKTESEVLYKKTIERKMNELQEQRTYIQQIKNILSATKDGMVGVRSDGTVAEYGNLHGSASALYTYSVEGVQTWRNVIGISRGTYHTVGVKIDGTVLATKVNKNCDYNQCNVEEWKEIIQVAAGDCHTIGLKQDGTVQATGDNMSKQCEVMAWSNIVAVDAGKSHTVGLREDGTVTATGLNISGQCEVSEWRNIVGIAAGDTFTAGLRRDGTVVVTGAGSNLQRDVVYWKDIAGIFTGGAPILVGIKVDGTILIAGTERFGETQSWKEVAGVIISEKILVGFKRNGKLYVAGNEEIKTFFKNFVSQWRLFQDYKMLQEGQRKKQQENQQLQETYRGKGVCQYCGGSFKGVFVKSCILCGKTKDY